MSHVRRIVILVLCLLPGLLVACQLSQPVSTKVPGPGIMVEIWANKQYTHKGDTLKLRGAVTNTSSDVKIFETKDRPVFDIRVFEEDKTSYWSDGKPLTAELTRLELRPGETKSIEMDYTVRRECCHIIVDLFLQRNPPLENTPIDARIMINMQLLGP